MSRERALLKRLMEWYDEMPGYGSIGVIASDARALLAEPEGEDAAGLSVICRDCGMLVAGEVAGNRVRWVECQSCKPPRSRAEGSDLSVDQGREFRVVDGLGDNNRAGKVTIDPTLLSPATPRSRAEAEAMLKRYDESVVALQEGPMEALVPDTAEFDDARAVLDRMQEDK